MSKIEIVEKSFGQNRNFCQKAKLFGQKLKFLSKSEVVWSKIEISVKIDFLS